MTPYPRDGATYTTGKPCIRGHRSPRKSKTHQCIECSREIGRKWRKDHPESGRKWKERAAGRKFGLSPDEFDALYDRQGGKCAICNSPAPRRTHGRLHVDHDHTNGAVRGLLCMHCNTGLGKFFDNPARLAKAIEYLRAKP